jgi:hypothetical protein
MRTRDIHAARLEVFDAELRISSDEVVRAAWEKGFSDESLASLLRSHFWLVHHREALREELYR